ncbi:hypothetical protein PoB_003475700 [Plakobranchus ocellatus]|uniref:Uncharacterized protein n=1 Tax=Plakobranchus ocellatus TaxID=259542 RepID=A0AAV4AMQ9_9GAST|nr:hypothetical protein PoB_003475700 [Plakobranchus ocellatus]
MADDTALTKKWHRASFHNMYSDDNIRLLYFGGDYTRSIKKKSQRFKNKSRHLYISTGRSDGLPGRAVRYQVKGPRPSEFSIALLFPPSTKWVARSLRPVKSKSGEESNGKLHIMSYAKTSQDLTPGSPMLGPSVGSTYWHRINLLYLFFPITMLIRYSFGLQQ